MKNISVVEKIEQDYVIVSSVRKGACGENCAACKSCKVERVLTKVISDLNVNVGDTVVIESDTFSVLTALFVVFLVPVILPIFLYFLFHGFGTVFSFISIIVGIFISCLIVYCISNSKRFVKRITPKIISIIK